MTAYIIDHLLIINIYIYIYNILYYIILLYKHIIGLIQNNMN